MATQEEGCACGVKLYCEAAHARMDDVPPEREIMASDRAMSERRERLIEFLDAESTACGEVELFVTIYDQQNHLLKHDPMPRQSVTVEQLFDETLEGPAVLRIRDAS